MATPLASGPWKQLPPPPAPPTPSRGAARLLPLVVPALAASIAWRRGHTTAAAVLATLGATIAIGSAISPAFRDASRRATSWLAQRAERVTSVVLLTAVYAIVFAPVSLVLFVAGRRPLVTGFDRTRLSYWDLVPRKPYPLYRFPFGFDRRTAPSPVSGPSRSTRLAMRFFVALVIGLALNVLGGMVLIDAFVRTRGTDVDPIDGVAAARASWYPAYWRELRTARRLGRERYRPFVLWRLSDFAGRFIHVRNGHRISLQATVPAGVRPVRVQFYGGSTMWGWYNRDEHTIPSDIARLAAQDGLFLQVDNEGETGWNTWQEVAQLSENVSSGGVPDLAVFYDGVNDVLSHVMNQDQSGPVHLGENITRAKLENPYTLGTDLRVFNAVALLGAPFGLTHNPLMDALFTDAPPQPLDVLARRTAVHYRGNLEMARALGDRRGFRVAAFIQPWFGTKRLRPEETALYPATAPMVGVYRSFRTQLDHDVVDLSSALDDAPDPVLIDWCHTNEDGAERIAEAIYRSIGPTLRELATRSGGPTPR